MIMDFTNRIAVVTGATSGIGESTTLKLLEKGAVVLAVGRNEEKGRQLAARPNCRFYACDLADAHEIKDMGKGSRAPSPLFCPAPAPATGSSTAPADKPGRLCRSGFSGAL